MKPIVLGAVILLILSGCGRMGYVKFGDLEVEPQTQTAEARVSR